MGAGLKAIPVVEFGEHVKLMHSDRDKLFEMEYCVCDGYFINFHILTFISLIPRPFGIYFLFQLCPHYNNP